MKNFPKISIIPLVEFIDASERKKITILKQQKNPPELLVARYRTARAAFSNYLIKDFDKSILIDAVDRLQKRVPSSDWSKNDITNSIEALRRFLNIEFPFKSLKCRFTKPTIKNYYLKGVNITVSPDLILEWPNNGKKYVGAIKFSIKKKEMSLRSGQLSASLLADFLQKNYEKEDVIVSLQHCMGVDVMNDRLFIAPKNYKKNMELIELACDTISDLWPNI